MSKLKFYYYLQVTEYESDRMTKVLKVTPFTMKQSLVDMAYSMIEAGKIKKPRGGGERK